jgi:hypothetical protein
MGWSTNSRNRASLWVVRLSGASILSLYPKPHSSRREARRDLIAIFSNDLRSEQTRFTESWFSLSTQEHIHAFVEWLGKSVQPRQ